MAQKLFVGGLPYRTTNDELRDAFAQAGEVARDLAAAQSMDAPRLSRIPSARAIDAIM